jgi:hypothetical protein
VFVLSTLAAYCESCVIQSLKLLLSSINLFIKEARFGLARDLLRDCVPCIVNKQGIDKSDNKHCDASLQLPCLSIS